MIKTIIPLFALLFSVHSVASKAKLAFIIDDVGNSPLPLKLSQLPKEVSLSIIPNTKFDSQTAYQAYSEGRDVMLHLPMQGSHKAQEPSTLTLQMQKMEFTEKVHQAINRIPFAVAINNHMGSLLTQHKKPMIWLMSVLKEQKMGFIDSRTTAKTVAQKLAMQNGIANNRRHVFLDHLQTEAFISRQFNAALKKASKSNETVIVIGHPHEVTLDTLKKLITKHQQKIELIPISQALKTQTSPIVKITKNSIN